MYESVDSCIIGYWRSNDMRDVLAVRYGRGLHKFWYSDEKEAELGMCDAERGRAASSWHWEFVTVNLNIRLTPCVVESSWNVMPHGDSREGKWRGNWRMERVASTLHTTSELGVSSITTADAHTSAASIWLKWRHRRFEWTRPFRRKTKSGFCSCAITFRTRSNSAFYRHPALSLDIIKQNVRRIAV